MTDSGFDFSVLSEFRDRLLAGEAAEHLLEPLLVQCRAMGLLKARGQQRTDATHVLAAVRSLHRLELVAETLRAALNALATIAPAWLQGVAPLAWYERYAKRIEDSRLPKEPSKRDAYAQTVGEDGFQLLDALESPLRRRRPCAPCRVSRRSANSGRITMNGRPARDAPRALPAQARCASRSHGNYHGRRRTSNPPMMLTPATAPKAAPSGQATWSM